MLTQEQLYNNKVKYLELLCKLNIDITELTKYLDSIDYFVKPFSSQPNYAYPGSLCEFALNTYYELAQLINAYTPGRYTEIDVIKVALFKDLYRAELYEPYAKRVKDEETDSWVTQLAYKYREGRPVFGDIGLNSYMIAKNYVQFSDEQIVTILQANTKETFAGDIHEILHKFPLVTLTKMAELAATYLGE